MKKNKIIPLILLILLTGCFGLFEEDKEEESQQTLFEQRITHYEITEEKEYNGSFGGLNKIAYSAIFEYKDIAEIKIYLTQDITNEIGIIPTNMNETKAEYDKNILVSQEKIYIYIKDIFGETYLKEHKL